MVVSGQLVYPAALRSYGKGMGSEICEAQISGLSHRAPTPRCGWVHSRAVKVTEETVKHLSDFYGLVGERLEVSRLDHTNISCGDQVVLEFRGRVYGEADEARELLCALLPVALDNVGGDRKARPNHLATQRHK